ncbi:hypothetical protein PPL_08096 [Heterostelium album PN500]|uniref:L-2-hydroxyglutarate dehydrogenase, mitochondrial n=1 Tax=Heterostelium pallidum (strain ATCC 26659 / Pp 5 / PN500) TaxID=670386 RepID=D3BIL7_HETP5|nr:hypothetical protein PPL_08096 [Heterostelium album PN500]EFA78641.1 hypothetical protein PPL_08096 [Heterostelium album PN500]|eukprot:XP_020430765.1 hypothetical protein PPL_08096 [Heterostelium album PN500]
MLVSNLRKSVIKPINIGTTRRLYCSSSSTTTKQRRSDGNTFDVAIVGGGIVGVATARELLMRNPNLSLVVLEQESEIGMQQSSHNSGVIHSGIYYKPGARARLCTQGCRLMYEYLERNKLPYERCGKLIVATTEEEIAKLEMIFKRGVDNGVEGLEMLDSEGIKRIEPHVSGLRAIYSPNTGITDFGLVAKQLGKDVQSLGGTIKLNFKADEFDYNQQSNTITIKSGSGAITGDVVAKFLITCTGLYSDRVAVKSYGAEQPKIVPFRDIYEWLMESGLPKLALKHWRRGVDEFVRDVSPAAFLKTLTPYMPSLKVDQIEYAGSGVRAQALGSDGEIVEDFVFDQPPNKPILHVRNSPSPSATASLAIAKEIANLSESKIKQL